jgi:hypothetical protein
MASCRDCVPEQDFEPNGHFGGFILPLTSVWESSTPLDATLSLGKIVVPCLKTYQAVLLFETLLLHRFEWVFPRLLAGSPFLPTLNQSEVIRDSRVAIDRFQWYLLGHYLLDVYLTPHPLDSSCASHALLAIQEHLVCGTNSCCFSCAQMLPCKLTVIVHGPLWPILS